jgi:hypothetical protein
VPVDPRTTNPVQVSNSSQHMLVAPPRIPTAPERPPTPPSNPNHTYDSCFGCFQTNRPCNRYNQGGSHVVDSYDRISCVTCTNSQLKCKEMTEDEYRRINNRCLPCRKGRLAVKHCSEEPNRPHPACVERRVVCEPYIPGPRDRGRMTKSKHNNPVLSNGRVKHDCCAVA